MNTRILGGNPSREKTTAAVAQPSIFYYRENILQHMCWRRLLPARRHPPAEGYNLLSFTSFFWKGATTPWLKASIFSTTVDLVSSIFRLDHIAATPYLRKCMHSTSCLAFWIKNLHQTCVSSSLILLLNESQIHSFDGCNMDLELSVKHVVCPYRYSLEEFALLPHLTLAHLSFSNNDLCPLYSSRLSQYHESKTTQPLMVFLCQYSL